MDANLDVIGMFNRIAPTYDLINSILSWGLDHKWRMYLRQELELHSINNKNRKSLKVLDVATGTGMLAKELAKSPLVKSVTGIDLSLQMLKYNQIRNTNKLGPLRFLLKQSIAKESKSSKKITLLQGDAAKLPFAENSFDVVTSAFGVRNFENLHLSLKNMHKVLRPQGKVYILEFSWKANKLPLLLKTIFYLYLRYYLPLIGGPISKEKKAYNYLYESMEKFPAGEDFLQLMNAAGLTTLSMHPLTWGLVTIYVGQKA